jgi:hypothetical protein
MKSRVASLFILALLSVFSFASQTEAEYSDPEGKYRFKLYSEWKAVSFSDAVGRQKTEFVYRDRSEGLLKISRQTLSVSLENFVREEEQNLKIYRSGYQRVTSEQFGGGALSGIMLSFFTAEGGRQMANAHYYLQDGNTVWTLRFTGKRGTLDVLRNTTDQIARSFRTTSK